ncbi:MAG: UDP-N-acetylmuramate--L-alanine ligase [Lachnospiraceae bacterium]|nr:UDP-N-acetylmuramate--L-alanine ligase [Lachnospiraceae bacterium]
MYQINFDEPCRVYFMGIGGISMSGLAEILMKEGFTVTGSDMRESDLTKQLEAAGAKINYQQIASNIDPEAIDVVVYTAAIHENHPELAEVIRLDIPRLTRAELLGQIMRNYKTSIAISGTHGKTTTTSMITEVMLEAGLDPTITVGGMLDCIHGNFHLGSSDCFITEACEYTNSFLSFYPTVEAVLNIEADHLDFFKDLEDIRHSFRLFMEKLPAGGVLVINSEIDGWEELTAGLSCRVVTFGLEDSAADFTAANVTYDEQAHPSFDLLVLRDGSYEKVTEIRLNAPGIHNLKNALACAAIALEQGVKPEAVAAGLNRFGNAHRRFEYKGSIGGVKIVDDYAHHPQEIDATLAAAREMKTGKIWCAFQSHTYTRTKALLDEFANSLSKADEVLLAPIFAARETDTLGISSQDIADRIERLGTKAHNFESFDEIETFILTNCQPGDLVITMGAGDIYKVGENLLGK